MFTYKVKICDQSERGKKWGDEFANMLPEVYRTPAV